MKENSSSGVIYGLQLGPILCSGLPFQKLSMKPDETTIFGDRGIKVDIGVFRYIQFHAVNFKIAKINLHFKTVSPSSMLEISNIFGH